MQRFIYTLIVLAVISYLAYLLEYNLFIVSIIFLGSFLAYISFFILKNVSRNKKIKNQFIQERKQHGIMTKDGSFKIAATTDWQPHWNHRRNGWVDWLEDTTPEMHSADTVYKWGRIRSSTAGRGGFAIERDGKIVAKVITWII